MKSLTLLITLIAVVVCGAPEAPAQIQPTGAPYPPTPDHVRSQLKIRVPGPVSLNVTESVRTTFETLGRMSGVNLVFGSNFPTQMHTFRIDGVKYFDALDLLAVSTRSFWQPVNETTIMVFDDTQQNRRDFESQLMETVYLTPGVPIQKMNEIVNQLRTSLSLRGVYQNESAKAIFVRARVPNVLLAEALIEKMSGAALRKEIAAGILEGFSESGGPFQTPSDVRSNLQANVTGTISLQMKASVREIFGNLATQAGLNLIFSGPIRNVDFKVDSLNLIDAMDVLAIQSGTFWQPLDGRTIQVLADTQQNRRDFATHIVKTVYLPVETPVHEMNGILNLLRTAMSLRGVYQSESAKAIVIKDTPGRVALAEKIIRQLNVRQDPITSATITARGLTETMIRGNAAVARPALQIASSGPISINLSQDVRASYEALAQIAGLRVSFDPRVAVSGPMPFQVNGADVLDALDYLSYQTGTFWKVVDDRTILVAPDTLQAHSELDPQITKVINLTNANDGTSVMGVLNVLRTTLSLRAVEQKGANAIEIRDTPQRVALAEQIIAALDKVR